MEPASFSLFQVFFEVLRSRTRLHLTHGFTERRGSYPPRCSISRLVDSKLRVSRDLSSKALRKSQDNYALYPQDCLQSPQPTWEASHSGARSPKPSRARPDGVKTRKSPIQPTQLMETASSCVTNRPDFFPGQDHDLKASPLIAGFVCERRLLRAELRW